MTKRKWTEEELRYLQLHYSSVPNIHEKLGRTRQSVSYKAWELGIRTDSKGRTDFNPYFFDKWTPNMAYVIGFIAADGNLFKVKGKESYRITITQYKDDEILKDISELMEYSGRIKKSTVQNINMGACVSRKDSFQRYDLVISSKYIHDRLCELGLSPNKSLILGKMDIPREYFRYFLRGYIDGDGSICYSKDKRKARPYYVLEVTILGAYNFLKWMQSVIHKMTGLPQCKPDNKTGSKIRMIRYRGSVAIPFCEWLYDKEETIHLSRKKEAFEEFLRLDSEYGPYPRYNMPCNFDISKLKI